MEIRGVRYTDPLLKTAVPESAPAQSKKAAESPAAPPAPARAKEKGNGEILTGEEREFFAKLFPDAAGSIQSHAIYTSKGKKPSTLPGTLIDRKG